MNPPTHTTNYVNTFIQVAEDCPAVVAEEPPRRAKPSVAQMQFDRLIDAPYHHTSDEVLFAVDATRKGIAPSDLEAARIAFFGKGQACFRSSPLTKRYGWGVHADAEGKIALVPLGTKAYDELAQDASLTQVRAMRTRR